MKGFKFTKFIKPQNVHANTQYEVYGGNFVMELILPNALKLNTFRKLHTRLFEYVKSHGGKYPQSISISSRQYEEYINLIPRYVYGVQGVSIATYEGIPLIVRRK